MIIQMRTQRGSVSYSVDIDQVCEALAKILPEVGIDPKEDRTGLFVTLRHPESQTILKTLPFGPVLEGDWDKFLDQVKTGPSKELDSRLIVYYRFKLKGLISSLKGGGELSKEHRHMAMVTYITHHVLSEIIQPALNGGLEREDKMSESSGKKHARARNEAKAVKPSTARAEKVMAKIADKERRDRNLHENCLARVDAGKQGKARHARAAMCAAIYWYRRVRATKENSPEHQHAVAMHEMMHELFNEGMNLGKFRVLDRARIIAEALRQKELHKELGKDINAWKMVVKWTGGRLAQTVQTTVFWAEIAWDRTKTWFSKAWGKATDWMKKKKEQVEPAIEKVKDTIFPVEGEGSLVNSQTATNLGS